MITLYHKEDRLLWLLEELRIGYRVQLGGYREGGLPGTARSDAQQQQSTDTIYDRITSTIVSSLSGALITKETPVITDDKQVVRETGAIVEYLIEKYGKGRFTPRSSQGKLDNIFFMHFAEGSFLPPLVLRTVFQTVTDKSPYLIRSFTNAILQKVSTAYLNQIIKDNFDLVDLYLQKDGGRAYLAGGKEPTGGDFMMSTPIATVVQSGAFTPEEIPQSMKEYFDRLKSRSAYQAAFAQSAAQTQDKTQSKL